MQRAIQISTLALLLALGGCSGETEEAPDITEAIPLEVDEPTSADAPADDDGDAGAPSQPGNSDTPALPGSSDANDAAGAQRARSIPDTMPDTMETGSNPPDFEVPKGSKVQRPN